MSWAEVMKINDNMATPLNKQMREMMFRGMYLFTETTTFTPDKSGWYKVIVVGSGGKCGASTVGAAGGVAISTLFLRKEENYEIIVNNSLVSGTSESTIRGYSSFGEIIAYNGNSGGGGGVDGIPGTATGGDYNYSGTATGGANGANVGVFIPGLMDREKKLYTDSDGDVHLIMNGLGILGHGGGQGYYESQISLINPRPEITGGCVLIIPLESEE